MNLQLKTGDLVVVKRKQVPNRLWLSFDTKYEMVAMGMIIRSPQIFNASPNDCFVIEYSENYAFEASDVVTGRPVSHGLRMVDFTTFTRNYYGNLIETFSGNFSKKATASADLFIIALNRGGSMSSSSITPATFLYHCYAAISTDKKQNLSSNLFEFKNLYNSQSQNLLGYASPQQPIH